jgi:hypothetical protein
MASNKRKDSIFRRLRAPCRESGRAARPESWLWREWVLLRRVSSGEALSPAKKRKRAEPVPTEPVRTQPKRGKRQSPTTEAPNALGSASNNLTAEHTISEAAAPPRKRVRFVTHSEREVTLVADDADFAAGSIDQFGIGPAAMASALSSSEVNPKGKGQGKDQSPQKPKRGRGRPPKARQPVVSGPVPNITMQA